MGQERIHEITEHLEGLLKSGSTEELERYLDKVEQYVRSWNFTVMYFGVLIFQMAAAVHGAVYVAAGDGGAEAASEGLSPQRRAACRADDGRFQDDPEDVSCGKITDLYAEEKEQ